MRNACWINRRVFWACLPNVLYKSKCVILLLGLSIDTLWIFVLQCNFFCAFCTAYRAKQTKKYRYIVSAPTCVRLCVWVVFGRSTRYTHILPHTNYMRISVMLNPLHCFRIDNSKTRWCAYEYAALRDCPMLSIANESTRDTTSWSCDKESGEMWMWNYNGKLNLQNLKQFIFVCTVLSVRETVKLDIIF